MMADGDKCYFHPTIQYGVVHVECSDYPDGTVTSAVTGEVIER